MSAAVKKFPGRDAVAVKGWLAAHKWLILRRASQAFFLALFLAGPLTGVWIVKGTLAASLTLNVLPLTDPFIALQSLFAGHRPETTLLIGAAIVLGGYLLVGGRAYCAWVCPVNAITDAAYWLRERLDLDVGLRFNRTARVWIMAVALLASLATGTIAWELVNPVTIIHREIVYGTFFVGGFAWLLALAVFLFDLAVSRRGWCGHLCPVGAFYGLIGRFSPVRVSAVRRAQCDDCMDCYAVCPDPHVITPALKGAGREIGPLIRDGDCTNCGRCIDVCPKDVYAFAFRFARAAEPKAAERAAAPEIRTREAA
ncbi:MAG: quinol dehydrogenase ferredoxin subunit NapH [Rhodospirillales bacterium]|nr:quinol dehydrogenase ferredoxin subunit NapH [Rhodospirillales bacterium]